MTHEKERSALYHVNTKITYLYRDANNWKQHNCVVVKGGVTPEQVKSIVWSFSQGIARHLSSYMKNQCLFEMADIEKKNVLNTTTDFCIYQT